MKHNRYEEESVKRLTNKINTGIPEEYAIFYAMAASSVGEGVLSACYHVCPTGVNFQFDTTFMYSMSVLIFLKVQELFRCAASLQVTHSLAHLVID